MARPGDARAMQGAVMPPPCNGCRRVLRCAALVLHCMLRGPAGYERCDAGLRACRFFACCAARADDGSVARSGWGIACLAERMGTDGSRGLQCGGGRSLGFVGDTVGRLGGWARVWKGGAGGGEVWVLEACDGLGVRIAGSGFGVIAGRV